MRNFLLVLFLVFTTSMCFQSCKASDVATKEWTFLVYLNGDNNLNSYGDKDVKEMMGVGSNDQVNIVVLRDFGSKQSSKVLYVNQGTTTTVFDYKKNVDTGDYHTLIDFFKYASENYPAHKYAVVIWDHGNGWMNLSRDEITKGISYDDTSGNHISTEQMGMAFHEMSEINGGKSVDILGMDACLMAMAEVIYEVKDNVDYIVGSEETEPGNGWDYLGALKPLVANPSMTPSEFSVVAAKSYITSYPTTAGTQSAIDVNEFLKSITLVRDFVNYSNQVSVANKTYFKAAVKESLYFAEASYKDFGHFLSLLASKTTDQNLKDYSLNLKESLANSVLYAGNTSMPNSTGISIWLPSSKTNMSAYQNLKWTKDTSWDSFISMTLAP